MIEQKNYIVLPQRKNKERNAGIDLLRLIGMLDIVIFHTIIDSNIYNRYYRYTKQIKYMEVFTNWHISNFGIISGIVGHKNYKTIKYSNLFYLWILVLFYNITVHYCYKIYNPKFYTFDSTITYFFPVIFNAHWYFSCYFGMYLFLPLINRGIYYLKRSEFTIIVFSLIGIFILWRDFNLFRENKDLDPFGLNSGRSMIGLIVFYIIGVYIGKYFIIENRTRKIYYYILCMIIFCVCGHLINHYFNYSSRSIYKKILKALFGFRLNSIATLGQSISLALFFSQIKFNKNIGKYISFLGQMAFSVYIIHDHSDIRYVIFKDLFKKYSNNLSVTIVLLYVFLNAYKVFIICIIIDCVRLFIFKLFRIRNFCLYLDKVIYLLIDKF